MSGTGELEGLLMFRPQTLTEQEAIHTVKGIEEERRLWPHLGKSPILMQTNPSHVRMHEPTGERS